MRRSRFVTFIMGLPAAVGAVLLTLTVAPAQAASTVNYVALGDSYSSGEGAGAYTSEGGACDRSPNAYPALWAAANSPASYVSAACSGATTTSVINTQLAALSPSTTLVSITVGGTDVGFSGLVRTCIVPLTKVCVGAAQAAEDRAQSTLPGLLDSVYNALSERAPNARVIVLGYPVFYQLGTSCIGLSNTARTKINELANLVDDIISNAAGRHGFTFADVRPAFIGHQLCSPDKWLHGLNVTDTYVSYHPTPAGQAGGYYPAFKAATG